MVISRYQPLLTLSLIILLACIVPLMRLVGPPNAYSAPSSNVCGNGVCQYHAQGNGVREDCVSCPADCGVCATPTPTPTPTPSPTNTPTPTPTPSSTPSPTSTPTPTDNPSPSATPDPTSTPTPTEDNNPTQEKIPLTLSGNAQNWPTNGLTTASNLNLSFSLVTSTNEPIQKLYCSTNNGETWNESVSTQFCNLLFSSDGSYPIVIKAETASGTTDSLSIGVVTRITTPPTVTLNPLKENPTSNTNPLLSGRILPTLAGVNLTEISLNNGANWIKIATKNNAFSYTTQKQLPDDTYTIIVRSTDQLGNTGYSKPLVLTIDTLPPRIGSSVIYFGPQLIDMSTDLFVIENKAYTVAVNVIGGPTTVLGTIDNQIIPFAPLGRDNLWIGSYIPSIKDNNLTLTIKSKDGANNEEQRSLGKMSVAPTEKLTSNTVTVFRFNLEEKQWLPWNGDAYQQPNPTKINDGIGYHLPKGTYYVAVASSDKPEFISSRFTASDNMILTPTLPRTKQPDNNSLLSKLFARLQGPSSFSIQTPANNQTRTVLPTHLPIDQTLLKVNNGILITATTWSPAFQEQVKLIEQLHSRHPEMSLSVVFIQESQAVVEAFMKRGNYTFPFTIDTTGEIAKVLQTTVSPTFYKVEAGVITKILYKALSEESLLSL